MTRRTRSEQMFEQLRADLDLRCEPIARKTTQTPDYDLHLGDNVVAVEIKQLDQNDDDQALLDKARRTGSAAGFSNTAARLRRKIGDANSQLKARTGGRSPALVVFFDNETFGGIDATDIKTAMFGDETVTVSKMGYETVNVTSIYDGGHRKMTDTCNTSISATALLWGGADSPVLSVFHNHFAVRPIYPDWFRHDRFRHFKLGDNGCYEWARC